MSFDMNKLMQQAAADAGADAAHAGGGAERRPRESSVGGGLVKVTANGAGEVLAVKISRDAIDPDDPEVLADLVLAGVNEALRVGALGGRGEGAADARRPRAPGARRLRQTPALRPSLLFSNWLWALIVLALIGIVVWGWAWDFAR